ncbi:MULTISPECIES: rod shape-determining protein RodA [Culturomica]|uniref:rod shape-determining protein RodA n=1 Tax=Culturomica TaxID=1926651 RepID=UPI000838EAE5|nr:MULTISPECIES: rod shape-determining protein RodA [Culturomica]HBO27147.1 rod shape-determining protein RodA [Culturomica sp.]
MNRQNELIKNIDWLSIFLYVVLVFMGWLNIYAAVYDDNHSSILDISQKYGKQLIWISASFVLGFFILLTDSKFFTAFSFVLYGLMIGLLVSVLLFGHEVNGARSWFQIGDIRIQPAEFGKFATALAVANVMSRHGFKMMRFSSLLQIGLLLFIPAALIILQNDTGSALVYSAFLLVMYREGLHGSILLLFFITIVLFIFTLLYTPLTVLIIIIASTMIAFFYYRQNKGELYRVFIFLTGCFLFLMFIRWLFDLPFSEERLLLYSYLVTNIVAIYFIYKRKMKHILFIVLASWLCIGATIMVDYAFDKLQPHQKDRINNLLGIETDLTGAGYNVNQSKIAIGSGGFFGKGYLQGTQTKYNFVPEQSTDFIFCTVGEEWGFIGSTVVILLFLAFILRIINLAERQRSDFSRVYGYAVACILFFHVAVNIGMTIGIAPVIGIPLPFFSYGGSSLWAFTILIFIFLRLDANRLQVFS